MEWQSVLQRGNENNSILIFDWNKIRGKLTYKRLMRAKSV